MQKNSAMGFSLIEFVCYVLVTVCIVYIMGQLTLDVYVSGLKQGNDMMQLLDIYTAIMQVSDDIAHAPGDDHAWKAIEPNRVIWNVGASDCGWVYRDHSLYRVQGRYSNNAENTALRHTLIARGLKSVVFQKAPGFDLAIIATFIYKRGVREKSIKIRCSSHNRVYAAM